MKLYLTIIFMSMLAAIFSCKNEIDTEIPVKPVYSTPVSDNEGNVYRTVVIGKQIWMAENLKTAKYNNGDSILTTVSDFDISKEKDPKYQWPCGDKEQNVGKYGRLYTWYTVMDSRGICPKGYHIPSQSEWQQLFDFLGGNEKAIHAIIDLSSDTWVGYRNWHFFDIQSTNSSGFSAVATGLKSYLDYAGTGNSFFWWTSSYNAIGPFYYESLCNIEFRPYNIQLSNDRQFNHGFSVRCVKD